MLDTMPSYLPDRSLPRKRRGVGPVQIEELYEMLDRPRATCEKCGDSYWADTRHVICTHKALESYL